MGLEVLRQHEDSGLGETFLDRERSEESFVRMSRRHADVDHGDVGPVSRDEFEQRVGVGGWSQHLATRLAQQPDQSLPEEGGGVGHRYPHGMWAITRVPLPEVSISRSPPSAAVRSSSPASPEPADALAPPTPSSATSTTIESPSRRALIVAHVARACLTTLARASEATK